MSKNKIMKRQGFTLVEIMVVLSIIVLLSANSFLAIFAARRTAEANVCVENRAVIQNAETIYLAHTKEHSDSFQELVDAGYLNGIPVCKNGGVYAWESYPSTDSRYHTVVVCSYHGLEAAEEEEAEEEEPEAPPRSKF